MRGIQMRAHMNYSIIPAYFCPAKDKPTKKQTPARKIFTYQRQVYIIVLLRRKFREEADLTEHKAASIADKVEKKRAFRQGLRNGLPIGLGYFAVAFSLGIAAKDAHLTAFQGFIASLFTYASAGEYAVFTLIAAQATYMEVVLVSLISNARYMLMSCALSQRLRPGAPFRERLLFGTFITDELFGINIARPGYLEPRYAIGAILTSIPLWALGTSMGIIMGNLLPASLVSALSVALYGMFLAIIVPPARQDKIIAWAVVISFGLSLFLSELLPGLSSGNRIIILTVAISAAAAAFFPVKEQAENNAA